MEELSSFLSYLETNCHYSPHTIKAYGDDVVSFIAFLNEQKILPECLSKSDVRLFIYTLRKKGLENSSIQRKSSALRHFYRYLCAYKGFSNNPFEGLKSARKSKKLPHFLTHEELEDLFKRSEERTDALAKRDLAILFLLFSSGLRAQELISLTFKQIDFASNEIRITGKGNKERITFFTEKAEESIVEYKNSLRVLLIADKDDDGTIFLNKRGEKLTERGLEYIVEEAGKKCSFPFHLHPHMFRHSFATELVNNGASLLTVQELLGHKSLATTSIYRDVSYADLSKTVEKGIPSLLEVQDDKKRDI